MEERLSVIHEIRCVQRLERCDHHFAEPATISHLGKEVISVVCNSFLTALFPAGGLDRLQQRDLVASSYRNEEAEVRDGDVRAHFLVSGVAPVFSLVKNLEENDQNPEI